MMWRRRHLFSEVLELKTGEQVVIVAIEVWGAHAPSRAISAPRRNASLVQLKRVVGEAPTTAREARALPGKEEPRAIMLRELRKPGTFVETFTPTKRLTLRIRRLDPLCALC